MKKRTKNKKILVAMSGGVDSSVATVLLKKQGYDIIGVFLKFWTTPSTTNNKNNTKSHENICCDQEALRSARAVADKLKIPFYVFDAGKEFKRDVVDYYINEYDSGRTPNPCVVCNKKIKFGWLLQKAKELGCDFMATGHYARLGQEIPKSKCQMSNQAQSSNVKCQLVCHSERSEKSLSLSQNSHSREILRHNVPQNDNILKLLKPRDTKKDQTYFLWQLNQSQLKYILFPLGDYTKDEVRKMAKKWKLPVYNKKESQNVCFIPDTDNADFLTDHVSRLTKPGNIVDKNRNILGKHQGLYKYTIGQRQGLGIANSISHIAYRKNNKRSAISSKPKYVIKLDIDKNELVVGEKKNLFSKELVASNVNWINKVRGLSKSKNFECQAKIRYGHRAERCKVYRCKGVEGKVKVIFDKPQRAITPGQSVVFYKGDELIGGGIIK